MIRVLALIITITSISSSKINTTKIFQNYLGHTLNYQTYSGYQNIDWFYPEGTAAIYYSFFQAKGKNIEDPSVPLIIWLSGGPGTSSQWSAYNMLGPLMIQKNNNTFSVTQNNYSWSQIGHVVFVDQPLNVGFSYNKNKMVDNSYDSANHFINFLYNFYEEWGLKNNPLYITGVSYAGHFIPPIARNIMTNMSLDFNLKGILIGGPWIEAMTQGNFVDSFFYSVGVASEATRSTMLYMQNQGLVRILNKKFKQASQYLDWPNDDQTLNKYFGGVDFSNFRNYVQDYNSYFYQLILAKRQQFGIPNDVVFKKFNQDIYDAFSASGDFTKSTGDQVDFILNRGLRVLFFNGQNDGDVTTAGLLTFLNTMQWNQLREWQRSGKEEWKIGSNKVGWVKMHSNFIFALVKDAGHLSPFDKPQACLSILNNFIHRIW